jgi:TolB-like protein
VRPDSAAAAAIANERGALTGSPQALGVTPFRLNSNDQTLTSLGFALADLLTTDLSRSAQLRLVERSRLGEVLRELDLAKSGRVDSATAPRVGQLLRARRLLLGSLDTLPNGELRLSVRIADVETGLIEQALDARAPLEEVLAAEKAVAFRMFEALGITLTPAERARVEARPTLSVAALAAYGKGVQAELQGDPKQAIDEFRRASILDPAFRAAVDRVGQNKTITQNATNMSTELRGLRGLEAPVSGVVDRLNRPLDVVTTQARPAGGAGDPAFPSTLVTVVIIIQRP